MKKYLLFIIISFILIGGLTYYFVKPKEKEEETSQDYLTKAEEYLDDKQYSKALEQLKLAINTDPSNAEAYLQAADVYLLKSDFDKAVEILQNGETTVTRADLIYHKIGQILFENNKIEEAMQYFELANSDNPNNWENAIDLVKSYSHYQDKKSTAIEVLENINLTEGKGYVAKNYYLALLSYDNIGTAITFLESAQNQAEEDLKGKIEKYLEVARKVQTDPEDIVQNNTLLAYELIRGELYGIAVLPLENAISENDEYYAAFMYIGICYMKMSDLEKARENLEKSVTIEPDEIQPYLFLAQVYTLLNNQQSSIDTYENALNIDKTVETVRYDFAKTLIYFELYQQARLEYKELINLNTQNIIQYKIELAALDLDFLDDYEEGLSLAKEVVEDWEDFKNTAKEMQAKALDILGWAYEKNNQKDEALKYLRRSLETYPYLTSAYYHLGIIYNEIENFSEARLNFERAIDLDTEGKISAKANNELENLSKSDTE